MEGETIVTRQEQEKALYDKLYVAVFTTLYERYPNADVNELIENAKDTAAKAVERRGRYDSKSPDEVYPQTS